MVLDSGVTFINMAKLNLKLANDAWIGSYRRPSLLRQLRWNFTRSLCNGMSSTKSLNCFLVLKLWLKYLLSLLFKLALFKAFTTVLHPPSHLLPPTMSKNFLCHCIIDVLDYPFSYSSLPDALSSQCCYCRCPYCYWHICLYLWELLMFHSCFLRG